jgi:hypothetical protein
VPTGGLRGNAEGYTVHAHVPVDDEHSLRFNVLFRRHRPITPDEKHLDGEFNTDFTKVRNIGNDYLIDRAEQRCETFIGLGKTFLIHDSCATESMGPRFDRSREHLGISDITVIAVRRRLLNIVRRLEAGDEPPHIIVDPAENDMRQIACIVETISASIDAKRHIAAVISEEKY